MDLPEGCLLPWTRIVRGPDSPASLAVSGARPNTLLDDWERSGAGVASSALHLYQLNRSGKLPTLVEVHVSASATGLYTTGCLARLN